MKLKITIGTAIFSSALAFAVCPYSRTGYKVETCRPLSTEKDAFAVVASTPVDALPGLDETPTGPLDRLTCECTYVLHGGNPLCDAEKTQEFSQNYPRDADAPVCPRGKSLCADLCPRQIP